MGGPTYDSIPMTVESSKEPPSRCSNVLVSTVAGALCLVVVVGLWAFTQSQTFRDLVRWEQTHQVSGGLIYVLIYAACALLLERNEIQFVVLVQFAYIPLFVKNYGLALLNVSFGLFLWTHVVCGVRTLLTVYIGHSATHMTQLLKSHAASGDTVTAQEILMVVAVVSTLLLVAVGSYRTKQYLDELAASELVPPVDKDRIVSCEV
ncbi:hypothetical protein DYB37_008620 [Aphanomyces astaci]|uniref:Uncharacterized protein n=1 Tax=Aphanomyces astaci TaxID=112090 RepID=A0A3R7B6K4_APHAT|nr:hypothetical protein DYB37_008620 [Aphanomyces astaci]